MEKALLDTDGERIPALEARWGRAPGVTFEQRFGGTVAVLEAAGSTAVIAMQGAQVLSWRPAGHVEDALWLSPQAKLGTGRAVRGGIPVCWPWFGPHPEGADKPAHGFVRAAPWRVAGSAVSDRRARLVLSFDATRVDPGLWPHCAQAEIEITVGEALTVTLSTLNVSEAPISLTMALHTYLSVGDIARVEVRGLEEQVYVDQLAGHARKKQSGGISFDAEVDRIYQATADTVIVSDEVLGREIRVAKTGSLSTVVWNPWIEKGGRLGDLGDDGYRRMVCIEAANAGGDTVTLAPGARHRMTTEISVQSV